MHKTLRTAVSPSWLPCYHHKPAAERMQLGPFADLPDRRRPTLLNRVLLYDGGADAAAEIEAALPSGTAD
ncbi:hypothetical protein M2158_005996 [Streptomyces sp. SAI-144]|uniref:hypothetical protein n=1 Tax=Streptomyces sp. SAI-144 TaxID=2940544 RepID=UPI0024762DD6|nr:hypothetical protein [Streptomyces sp. SAI-144]MDH6437455.1 hypothetical protein [Streptomyces sp. SAI-144]